MVAPHSSAVPPPDPASARTDRTVLGGIAGIVLAAVLICTLAPAPHRTAAAAAVAPSADLACAEWGDGCRVCQRREEGPACSLPGIACVAGETRCLRRTGD